MPRKRKTQKETEYNWAVNRAKLLAMLGRLDLREKCPESTPNSTISFRRVVEVLDKRPEQEEK